MNMDAYENVYKEILQSFNLNIELKYQQKQCLSFLLEGNDVFGVLPTGFGKSLIFTLLPKTFWKVKFHKSMSTSEPRTHDDRNSCIVLVISPLVALMKDQETCIKKTGLECAYLGDQQSIETQQKIINGRIPLLLVSPESLFTGDWREKLLLPPYQKYLCAIVIDEAHCVEEWGNDFRTDYSRIGELRSIFPKAVMLALTATATKDSREKIANVLGMTTYKSVIETCNRSNIFYFCQEAPYSLDETFSWLIDHMRCKRNETPKSIIYCRNIKSCAQIYALFLSKLGMENSYVGNPCAQNCLYAMFHHSTSEKNKKIILENFGKPNSITRVVIATTAFGMGINVLDIRYVIHWGASRNLQGFSQESGRAGRDGLKSVSIVYYHGHDISKIATDTPMHNYCKTTSCRRQFLVNYFTPEINVACRNDYHDCCDIWASSCSCANCRCSNFEFYVDLDDKVLSSCDIQEKPYREVSEQHRSLLFRLLKN